MGLEADTMAINRHYPEVIMSAELKQILYVEDDQDIQRLVQLSLESLCGYKLTVCSSGQEALELADSIQPQLVLLDVMMPGMDGVTLFKELREKPAYQNLPFVFITAKVQKHEVEEYRKLGAAGVIVKPFSPDELANLVGEFWRRHHRDQ